MIMYGMWLDTVGSVLGQKRLIKYYMHFYSAVKSIFELLKLQIPVRYLDRYINILIYLYIHIFSCVGKGSNYKKILWDFRT